MSTTAIAKPPSLEATPSATSLTPVEGFVLPNSSAITALGGSAPGLSVGSVIEGCQGLILATQDENLTLSIVVTPDVDTAPTSPVSAVLSVTITGERLPRENIRAVDIRARGSIVGARLSHALGFDAQGVAESQRSAETRPDSPLTLMFAYFPVNETYNGDYVLDLNVDYVNQQGQRRQVSGVAAGNLTFTADHFEAELPSATELHDFTFSKRAGVGIC